MENGSVNRILNLIKQDEEAILRRWLEEQAEMLTERSVSPQVVSQTQTYSRQLLTLLASVPEGENVENFARPAWNEIRALLQQVSNQRVEQGFTPSETATFVFSLKRPLFAALREEFSDDAEALANAMWEATMLLDNMGLYTVEEYQRAREKVISQQRREIYELSTPVVQLWEQILAVPLIGTLDSVRTQMVMESVLNKIVETNSRIIIIDITGVPVVDTLVAQHIMKTAQATRLMGAECFISGISPQIAQTIVHLGISLNELVSRATLKEAFALALKRIAADMPKV